MSDLEKKKILSFGYEDTDKKIEIECSMGNITIDFRH